MTNKVIDIQNISKSYELGMVVSGSLRETLANSFRWLRNSSKKDLEKEFWALKNVSFDVNQGEVVGIVGKNGAGKSTLLKVLSRITEPTSGRIELNGRVASLLEVGTGFHAELTGRQNIFLNGSILGMTRKEINSKLEEIIDFSGVEKFIDTPVKRYSSGMYVRLAFAVAAHLEPEILVIDEVLAVGDADFQKKCLGKMGQVAKGGRTILFVSHNMGAVKELCTRAILLEQGQSKMNGDVSTIIDHYLKKRKDDTAIAIRERTDRKGTGDVLFDAVRFIDTTNGVEVDSIVSGSNLAIEIDYRSQNFGSSAMLRTLEIGFSVYNNDTQFCTVLNNKRSNFPFTNVPKSGTVVCTIPNLPLMVGDYYFRISMVADGAATDWIEDACKLNVLPSDYYAASYPLTDKRQGVYVPQKWSVK